MLEKFKPNFNKNEQEPENKSECNIYGKEKFSPETAKEHVESLVADFKEHYSAIGYKEEPPVQISLGIDSTVDFIGSHISVLKPYLFENRIPTPGISMSQDCIRTWNVNRLLDDDYTPNWGSYFKNIGAISPAQRLPEMCDDVFDFLEKKLGIGQENILIRVSSED